MEWDIEIENNKKEVRSVADEIMNRIRLCSPSLSPSSRRTSPLTLKFENNKENITLTPTYSNNGIVNTNSGELFSYQLS